MRNLHWKIGIALLTFFIGTILVLICFAISNNPTKSVDASPSLESEITTSMSSVAKNEPAQFVVSSNTQVNEDDNNRPIRFIKGGGENCEKYLLKKIAKEKAESNRMTKLKNFNLNDESLFPDVKKWLQNMREDILIAFELRNNEQKALLLSSTSYGATGLATNLENWHVEIGKIHSFTFWSFSKNPKLVFWDKDGLLNYYSVVYSDEFISNKDWENLTVDLERYRISFDGKAQLVSEEGNVKCE